MALPKTHSSVSFNLIRDTNDKTNDDFIIVKQTHEYDIVHLCYKDRVSGTQHEVRMTKDRLSEYCISLFHILSYDNDPFKFVQVNFPAFPSVLLNIKDLEYESLRERIQSMLWFTLDQSFSTMNEEQPCY